MRIAGMFLIAILLGLSGIIWADESSTAPVNYQRITTAVIERALTYQGILKDNAGEPVPDATYNLVFRIYTDSTAGDLLWTSVIIPVITKYGYFKTTINLAGLAFDQTYYLSVQVGPDPEMIQRQPLTMTPYSAVSDTANYSFVALDAATALNSDQLDGQHASAFSPTGHNHDVTYVNEGQSNSITSTMITNATISFSDIGQNGAATGEAIRWSGSTWTAAGVDESHWSLSNDVLYTNDKWGIARGGSNNISLSDSAISHVNLGVACTTGQAGYIFSHCVITGGYHNIVKGNLSTICGGKNNTVSDFGSSIIGGQNNYIDATLSFIGGGQYDTISNNNSVVAGGAYNVAGGTNSAIGGGVNNRASASGTTISGGGANHAEEIYAAVGGGYYNNATGKSSVVGGGGYNSVTDSNSVISGGIDNVIDGTGSAIGGGTKSSIGGDFSAIPGGYGDTISSVADYSMVFGRGVYVSIPYRIYFFDGDNSGRLTLNRDSRDGGASHPIQIGTDATNGNGAYLTAGGVWTNGSSRTFKENFVPMDGSELLSKISSLSIVSYNYKNSTEKHFGPMAEDFVGAFDTGVIREEDGKRDDMYLSSGDVAGVALAGVQELLKEIKEIKIQNAALEKRISELENR